MTPVLSILSLFPDVLRSVLDSSILRRAQVKGRVELEASDLRAFAGDAYRSVDDTPFGGQQGMLFRPEVLEAALQDQLKSVDNDRDRLKVIYTSPRGVRLEQEVLQVLSTWLVGEAPPAAAPRPAARRLVVICGRYEGVDERIVRRWVDLELSLGDFILTGGELPALVLVDGIVRLLPGVLGDSRSAVEDSFSNGLLEHPQFTKPRSFAGQDVPSELTGGNHQKILDWKLRQSLQMTYAFRPDLIRAHTGAGLPDWAQALLREFKMRIDLRS